MNPTGIVFDIQRFSIHDGPGIRTTVFLKGCPLQCPWCHNPEAMIREPQLLFYEDKCIRCGRCFDVCPVEGALNMDGEERVDRDLCTECGKCAEDCCSEALEMCGKEMTVDEVIAEVEKDRPFYETSGGGMTVSGGEPLKQDRFTIGLLKAAKEAGLHTTVDSCGLASESAVREVAPYTDLVLFDLKVMDSAASQETIGASNEHIHDMLNLWDRLNVDIIIRIPVIPGYTDSEENVRGAAALASLVSRVKKVDLMKFHRLGETKWKRLGMEYPLNGAVPPNDDAMNHLKALVESHGLTAEVQG
ncbi:MAG: glycyl-radical enzyme activating protein [Planctomycetota bacterium]|nr:glycyl-radical enzyme activating protein [Planctomycetota bacterium]